MVASDGSSGQGNQGKSSLKTDAHEGETALSKLRQTLTSGIHGTGQQSNLPINYL